ncbi:uncharacterized protein LOC142177378 [Nicotiana tabacum]|uniref:Uncharacterized protein LOC142177378 n=1 Tax=Nicotiana tabacum TaxID=4097 RepID=A0AC58TXI0_TOBAC
MKNDMALSYIAPQLVNGKVVIQLEKEEVERETKKWRGALIAYDTISSNFNPYMICKKSFILALILSIIDPIILKLWTIDFDFDREFPTEISLWVKFLKLPMNCWGKNSLSRIASAIGIPMYADECTAKQTCVSFARMLVEVIVTKLMLDEIEVMNPNGRIFQQAVTYD